MHVIPPQALRIVCSCFPLARRWGLVESNPVTGTDRHTELKALAMVHRLLDASTRYQDEQKIDARRLAYLNYLKGLLG